jgi:hypothetical protein
MQTIKRHSTRISDADAVPKTTAESVCQASGCTPKNANGAADDSQLGQRAFLTSQEYDAIDEDEIR